MNARDEEGAVLLLAMGFLVFFSLVIGATLTFAEASLLSTQRLREQRSTAYAADGAIDAAIQVGRSDTGVGGYGDARCQAPGTSSATPVLLTTTASTSDATQIDVICNWSPDFLQPDRTVVFTSFLTGTTTPLAQAKVIYLDSGGTVPAVNVVSWTYCGHDAGACAS